MSQAITAVILLLIVNGKKDNILKNAMAIAPFTGEELVDTVVVKIVLFLH